MYHKVNNMHVSWYLCRGQSKCHNLSDIKIISVDQWQGVVRSSESITSLTMNIGNSPLHCSSLTLNPTNLTLTMKQTILFHFSIYFKLSTKQKISYSKSSISFSKQKCIQSSTKTLQFLLWKEKPPVWHVCNHLEALKC